MKTKSNFLSKSILGSGFAVALAFTTWLSVSAFAADETKDMQHPMGMQQIKTLAEAEALKPGDMMAMACSKCKFIMVHIVTADKSHAKMMTIGDKHKCKVCDGTVEVVGTGKGEGKNEEVNHVCSHCGDDAMFVCATKPGSGAMKGMKMDMKDMKKGMKKGKE
jgi:hypothetical protein